MHKGYLRNIMENNELKNKKVYLSTFGCQMEALLHVSFTFSGKSV